MCLAVVLCLYSQAAHLFSAGFATPAGISRPRCDLSGPAGQAESPTVSPRFTHPAVFSNFRCEGWGPPVAPLAALHFRLVSSWRVAPVSPAISLGVRSILRGPVGSSSLRQRNHSLATLAPSHRSAPGSRDTPLSASAPSLKIVPHSDLTGVSLFINDGARHFVLSGLARSWPFAGAAPQPSLCQACGGDLDVPGLFDTGSHRSAWCSGAGATRLAIQNAELVEGALTRLPSWPRPPNHKFECVPH